MRAWRTVGDGRLELGHLALPEPADGELLVRVEACGVCRTDLHVIAGELPRHRSPVVPGHEIVGEVVGTLGHTGRIDVGDRVGVPWLRATCGTCRWCRSGAENLCRTSRYTGWDADGGYAEYAVAPAAYVYPVPASLDAVHVAPLLCAGIIGYRALKRAAVPPGGLLGLYGFGASAHLTAQLALAFGAEVHVVTRGEEARLLARELGASTAVSPGGSVPPLDAAIVFAPAGDVVAEALAAVGPHGTVAVAGIHVSQIPPLDYATQLFDERTLTSVTSNTRTDGAELMRLAGRLGLRPSVACYPLSRADVAVSDLAADRVRGVAVLETERP
ncbi:zinc-binding alcohol dehydrogenase family protein [Nocardioides sp. AN3]